MANFKFYHPIEVRYGDLDPQGHLNNAKYLTYMEQARLQYTRHLGLWNSGSFLDVGVIMADVQLTFRAPVEFGTPVRVGVRIAQLGNKSLHVEQVIENARDGQVYANGRVVLVAFDYRSQQSVPIPEKWRKAILEFENLE
ncbi:MAG: acyl-CoA thioesterase [Anaerolineales bacterium]|nr:acyl-CoA thioesterase [Anaerolineales bacterium]